MRIVVTGTSGDTGSSLRRVLAADPEVDAVDLVGVLRGATVMVHLAWLFQPARWSVATWQVTGRS
jgi:nucleoside-diphosphate-sugar epimerase